MPGLERLVELKVSLKEEKKRKKKKGCPCSNLLRSTSWTPSNPFNPKGKKLNTACQAQMIQATWPRMEGGSLIVKMLPEDLKDKLTHLYSLHLHSLLTEAKIQFQSLRKMASNLLAR